MYEVITYESILKRMLNRVPNQIDKREGSVIYDALAPAAVELQLMYIELDVILKETFADTASRDYLILRAAERGIIPYPATFAVLRGMFTPSALEIPLNSRFSLNELNYKVVEKVSSGVYELQCETAGIVGNSYFGDLIPIEYINGLETARITELLIPGDDEEDTEHLRQRYFESLDSQAFGGNMKDYKEKVNSLSGVGGVKVYPVWNGGGTVKLVIMDATKSTPSSTLIEDVQTAVDPVQNQGIGVGFAPIGHVVTVEGVKEFNIDVETEITYQAGWNWDLINDDVRQTINDYFKELSSEWEDNENLIVRISQIETRLLDLSGILDVARTKLNGADNNIQVSDDSIPILGEVTDNG